MHIHFTIYVPNLNCTKNKNGRFIERSIYQEALDENQKRVNQNPEYYRLRQQITEHQFGTLKRQWGFTFTLMKGKQNVLSEVNLMMICYNLRRLMSIFTIDELKYRMEVLKLHVLSKTGSLLSLLPPFISKSITRYPFAFIIFKSSKRHIPMHSTI